MGSETAKQLLTPRPFGGSGKLTRKSKGLIFMLRKLNMGMVGGGPGAFVGGIHRMAARLDGEIELVAGAFSADPDKTKRSGEELFLDPQRVYHDYRTMVKSEAELPVGKRIDFVSIVTPNHLHFPMAKEFLEAGFNVVCDKPMTFDLKEALALRDIVRRTGKVFVLTHNYVGYPIVKEARELVRRGTLGSILKVIVEYPQGWLLRPIDAEGQKQAVWRTDPEQSGASACVADIGTHAENLARYITGLRIEELRADFKTYVAGRRLEDDADLLLRYKGGLVEYFMPLKFWPAKRMTSTFEYMVPKRLSSGIKKTRAT